jgi:hypothetical protein
MFGNKEDEIVFKNTILSTLNSMSARISQNTGNIRDLKVYLDSLERELIEITLILKKIQSTSILVDSHQNKKHNVVLDSNMGRPRVIVDPKIMEYIAQYRYVPSRTLSEMIDKQFGIWINANTISDYIRQKKLREVEMTQEEKVSLSNNGESKDESRKEN